MPPSCKLDLTTDRFSSLGEEFYFLVDIIEQKFNAAEDAPLGDTLRLSRLIDSWSTLSVRSPAQTLVRYLIYP